MPDGHPLFEHDSATEAILEPGLIAAGLRVPSRVVLCFFWDIVQELSAGWTELGRWNLEAGPVLVWETTHRDDDGNPIAVVHPGTGAPTAVSVLEILIAAGARTVVAVGGAGALLPQQNLGAVVVPNRALRDEGTSYHYLPASRWIDLDVAVAERLSAHLNAHDVPHEVGSVWTTDGIFRETRARVDQRVDEGCLLVEMECSALAAVSRFREITFGQILYAGDSLAGAEWDSRGWNRAEDVRRGLLDLAISGVGSL